MTQDKADPSTAAPGTADAAALSPEQLSPEQLSKVAGGNIFIDIGNAFEDAAEAVANAFKTTVDTVADGTNSAINAAEVTARQVAEAIEQVGSAMADGLDKVAEQAADGAIDLSTYVYRGGQVVYDGVALPLADIVANGFEAVSGTLVDVFEPLGEGVADVFSGDFSAAAGNFSEGFGNAFEALESAVEEAHRLAGEALDGMAGLTGEAAEFLMTSVIAEGFEAVGFDSAADYSRGLGTFLDDSFDAMGDAAAIGLTSVGNAYGAFIQGAANMPDFVSGLSTAVGNVVQGDFVGARNAVGDVAGSIQDILAEGLSEWGKGMGGIVGVMDVATKTVGELAADLAQGFVMLSAEVAARAADGVGLDDAADRLRSYAETVNNVIETLQAQAADQAGLFPGKRNFDILGAAAESAALLIQGRPEEAGDTFLREAGIVGKVVNAAKTFYESDIAQEVAASVQGFGEHMDEFNSMVQARIAQKFAELGSAQDLIFDEVSESVRQIGSGVTQSLADTDSVGWTSTQITNAINARLEIIDYARTAVKEYEDEFNNITEYKDEKVAVLNTIIEEKIQDINDKFQSYRNPREREYLIQNEIEKETRHERNQIQQTVEEYERSISLLNDTFRTRYEVRIITDSAPQANEINLLLRNAADDPDSTSQTDAFSLILASVREVAESTLQPDATSRLLKLDQYREIMIPNKSDYQVHTSYYEKQFETGYQKYVSEYYNVRNLAAAVSTVQLAGAATLVTTLKDSSNPDNIDTDALMLAAMQEVRQELGAKYRPAGTEFSQ